MNGRRIPFVSVILPVYNDLESLVLCLEALENQTYPNDRYEVLVVDNGSKDSIEPVVSRFACATAAREDRPGSYSARNKGLSLARGQVVAFTDSDCIPTPQWLEKGVEKLLVVPDCGLVAGRVEVYPRNPSHPTAVELYECACAFPQQRSLEVGKFGVTANLFTFRSVFEDVGFFDDGLLSGGDYEWCRRVYWHGYKQAYAQDACVYHRARYNLGQLHRRIIRLAGGVHDLKQKEDPHIGLERDLLLLFVPPVRAVFRVFKEDRPSRLADKAKVIPIIFLAKYLNLWSRLRLLLRDARR
jgi:glycosyltransferase involved in cell wall biosynthesis